MNGFYLFPDTQLMLSVSVNLLLIFHYFQLNWERFKVEFMAKQPISLDNGYAFIHLARKIIWQTNKQITKLTKRSLSTVSFEALSNLQIKHRKQGTFHSYLS